MDTDTATTTPITCREAAAAFRRAADRAVYDHEAHRAEGQADLLEAMGDVSFPAHLVEEFPGVFSRGSM